LALVAPLVALADDSDTLQKQAIQRIDHYRDYVRHTGDVASASLLREQQRASKCDYEANFAVCDEAFQLAHNDYQQALKVARALGHNFLAGQVQKLLQSSDAKRQLTQNQGRYQQNVLAQPATFSTRRKCRTC
jgi:hypothetical protein